MREGRVNSQRLLQPNAMLVGHSYQDTHTNLGGAGFMKKIIAGLAMATIFSGIVWIPTTALADDGPACPVFKSLPPLPIGPPSRCG